MLEDWNIGMLDSGTSVVSLFQCPIACSLDGTW
jgi:hypothetical protein